MGNNPCAALDIGTCSAFHMIIGCRPNVLMLGCPCQPCSASGTEHGYADARIVPLHELFRYMSVTKPKAVMLESAKGLAMGNGWDNRQALLRALRSLGYVLNTRVLDPARWSPVCRSRLLAVAVN